MRRHKKRAGTANRLANGRFRKGHGKIRRNSSRRRRSRR